MTNPTTAKPTTAYYGSGLTFGTNLQSGIYFTEGSGSPSDCRTQIVGQSTLITPLTGLTASFAPYSRSGNPPQWISNGFPGYGYSLHFDHSTRPLFFGEPATVPGTATAFFSNANTRTIACVFKSTITAYNRTNNIPSNYPLVQVGTYAGTGIALSNATIGSVNSDKLFLVYTANNSISNPIIPLEIVQGHWYAAAVVISPANTPSAGLTTKTWYLYDYTLQAYHPASGLVVIDSVNSTPVDTVVSIGAFSATEESNPFVGDFAAVSLHEESWSSANFTTYITDPVAPGRGTASTQAITGATNATPIVVTSNGHLLQAGMTVKVASVGGNTAANGLWKVGTVTTNTFQLVGSVGNGAYTASTGTWALTANLGRFYDADTNNVNLTYNTQTSGTSTFTCWKAPLPTTTPGGTNSVQLSSGLISASSGGTVVINDSGVNAGQAGMWYTLVSTDGSAVNAVPVYGRPRSKPNLIVGIIGDSKEQQTFTVTNTMLAAEADNRKLTLVNWSRGSAGLLAANVANWQIGNVITATNQACTIAYKNGSATGGTFNLILPGASPVTFSSISYNTSVSALQTIIDTALGTPNLLVVSGTGTLDSNTFTITGGSSGTYHNTPWPLPVFDLANAANLTGQTATQAGEPVVIQAIQTVIANPGTTANNLYTLATAEFARNNVKYVILQNSANDVAGSPTWQTALSAQIADLLSRGMTPLVRYPQIRQRSFGTFSPDPATDANWWGFIPYIQAAVAANPGCKIGNENNYSMVTYNYNSFVLGDAVHETATYSAAVGIQQYQELVAAFDPGPSVVIGG